MKIEEEIEHETAPGEYDYLTVELEAEPFWQDDSFSYAGTHCTHGIGGIHRLPSYPTLEDRCITWDKSKYSTEENSLIENYVETERDSLEERFCNKLREQAEEYCEY